MEPFLGQIMMVGFNFAPRGWAFCDGRLLPISSYSALFSLLGTMYGGDGRTTFALPDLRGRVAIGMGHGPGLSDRRQGQYLGQETHTLTVPEIPSHNHSLNASNTDGTTNDPTGNVIAKNSVLVERGGAAIPANGFVPGTPNSQMNLSSIGSVGGSQSHNNMQPLVVMNYVIALNGIFPSRN
ncbi:phage tail protein [Algoriphagus aestuarii]|nr:phage tail protein [Algoriphagus aestuarii]